MRTSYIYTIKKITNIAYSSLVLLTVLLVASACTEKEFHMGADIVDGDKITPGEATFPVKAWTVRDITRDTLTGRAVVGKLFDPTDVTSSILQYSFNMVGNYSIPGVCDVKAGFATQLQLGANFTNFGDIIVDSVEMVISYTPINDLVSSSEGFVGYNTNLNIYTGVFNPLTYVAYGSPINNDMSLEIYRLAEDVPNATSSIDGTSVTKENFIPLNKKWALAEKIHEEYFRMEFDTIKSTSEISDTTFTYDDEGNVTDTTYIYADSIYPRMAFKMDTQYWQDILDHFKGGIVTSATFNEYFKGLYFKASDYATTPLMMFDLFQTPQGTGRQADICIYYHTATNTGLTLYLNFYNSTSYAMNSANSIDVTYEPKIEAMMENPDTVNGEKDLYILPFGGSEVVVDLISDEDLETIRKNGWIINDAYIEFTNKGFNTSIGNFPAVELWMYRYPYGYQFIYYSTSLGYPMQKVGYYLPDEATFTESTSTGQWIFTPRYNYGLNGIINENSELATFSRPGKYRMRVTRTLIDLLYNTEKKVKLGLRLPMGTTQRAPFMSVLDGTNLKLNVKYTVSPNNASKTE
ncbi:MAG: DUF4270 family protein [Flavobacteriales bacterium]|nr:DUF4270 family protein [Flavobacteriales bacterium]